MPGTGETVTLTYRGKDKGVISGIRGKQQPEYVEFLVFGMWADQGEELDVDASIRQIRKGRF